MPANILPFRADLSIDEPAYRKHLRWLADTPGVTGIVANGHAGRGGSLSREERRHTLAVALDEVAGACPVVAGRVHRRHRRGRRAGEGREGGGRGRRAAGFRQRSSCGAPR